MTWDISAPIRVLVLDTGKEWGGGTNSLFELLKRIDRRRFAVTACFYQDYRKGDGSSLSREFDAIDIPLHVFPPVVQPFWAKLAKELVRGLLSWSGPMKRKAVFAIDRVWRIRPRARQIAALMKSEGTQLLYMNNQPSSNMEGYLASEIAGIPVVQHCRIEADLNREEAEMAGSRAAAIVCVSHGVAESLLAQGVKEDRLHVVCNAIDGSQTLPAPVMMNELPTEAILVGTVGSLIRRKSVDQILRAVAALKTDVPVHVLVVGEGPEEAFLKKLAYQLGMETRVHFAGFQSQALAWMAAMDVVVLASAREGLPRVLLEAMLLGKPVVASRVVGSRELVVDGTTGFLYEYGDEPALSGHLQNLIGDEALRQRLGAAGHARVLENYSIERYVASVEEVLASAAGACGP